VTGPMGFDTVTVAGLTVQHQEFSRVTRAAYLGEGVSMGIIGLAHPDLTYVYNTSDPAKDSPATFSPYDPFFFSAVKQKQVAPCEFRKYIWRTKTSTIEQTSRLHLTASP
jgi:hypothetical protein